MLKLYCFGKSGNAYKAVLARTVRPASSRFRLFAGEARSEAYKANINEMGEVPVLVDTETGYSITQSGAIAGLHLASVR